MEHQDPAAAPGEQVAVVADAVAAAVSAIQRWGTRPEVRRAQAAEGVEPLTPTEGWLLGRLAERGPVRMSDLAYWQGVDRSTITAQVRRLESRRLVERAGDPTDGRGILVSLTERGRQARECAREVVLRELEGVLAPWGPGDRRDFVRLLTTFTDALDRAAEEEGRPTVARGRRSRRPDRRPV